MTHTPTAPLGTDRIEEMLFAAEQEGESPNLVHALTKLLSHRAAISGAGVGVPRDHPSVAGAREISASRTASIVNVRIPAAPVPPTPVGVEPWAWQYQVADREKGWETYVTLSDPNGSSFAHNITPLYASLTTPEETVSGEVEQFVGSCPSCHGTGDLGGNPSYGMCPDCDGTGKQASDSKSGRA